MTEWGEWSKYVLEALKRLESDAKQMNERLVDKIDRVEDRITTLEKELIRITAQAKVWGTIIGFGSGIVSSIIGGVVMWIITR